jgi:hypothetical protein
MGKPWVNHGDTQRDAVFFVFQGSMREMGLQELSNNWQQAMETSRVRSAVLVVVSSG